MAAGAVLVHVWRRDRLDVTQHSIQLPEHWVDVEQALRRPTCDSDVTIALPVVDNVHHFLWAGDEALSASLHVRNPVLVLVDSQVGLG